MKKEVKKEEKIIDASNKILGRVASEAAISLMGKTKATFERNKFSGFPVRVINASKLRISTKKLEDIFHVRYSGMRGGLRVLKGAETAEKKGLNELIKLSIYRMLPGNKLRKTMMKNLKIEN